MAEVMESKKACAVNPLKMSAPLGAAYAFMGVDRCMPVMHGSQGCTSFGLVLLVRHFKEAIPLQTTAMNEVTTILGGYENVEQALLNIRQRAGPRLIGICSTGLTETKGDDVIGYLALARQRKPELADTEIVYVSTPDYVGAFQDGYARAVTALVQGLVRPAGTRIARQVNVLAGSHLTPGDIDELRQILAAFGLTALVLPDVSGSLDGHVPDDWRGTTLGGIEVDQVRTMGASCMTLAIGEQMRSAAMELEMRAAVPYRVFDRVTGLAASDRLVQAASELSGVPVPPRLRQQRSQLLDAMLDGHFHFGGVRVAVGAEPDLLFATGMLLHEMGATLQACVTTTPSPVLAQLPAARVLIGDLEDLEREGRGCDLIATHSHGRQMAQRLHRPLYRIGMPIFDRIGNSHRISVGYRGTRDTIFEIANLLAEHRPHAGPRSWPLPEQSLQAARVQNPPAPSPTLSTHTSLETAP